MSEPRPLPYDWKDIRQRLQQRLPGVLRALGIDTPIRGGKCVPLNPRRGDRSPGSFVIWCEGDAAGAWKDYACGDECRGDVFDLIVYLAGLREIVDAYWWALDHLGLQRGEVRSAEAAALDRQRAEADRLAAEAKRQAADEGRADQLAGEWYRLAPIAGTLAERYLVEARGIDLTRIRTPHALRFAPRLDHMDRDTGEVTTWPCMVAARTLGKKVVGVHRTWLRPDGLGKADVARPKMMFGRAKGSAIRLASGPSGVSPTKAAERGIAGPLAIGEGIETALTAAVARPDFRVWAAGSLGHFEMEWPPAVNAVVLLRDNDLHPEAVTAFERAVAHWRAQAQGRPVGVVASAMGSDLNDWEAA